MLNNCRICGGAMRPWLYMPLDPIKNETTEFGNVYQCTNCGYGSVAPLPHPIQIQSFYEAEKYYTQGQSHVPPKKPDFWDKVISKFAYWIDKGEVIRIEDFASTIHSNCSVLDIGAGNGHKLSYAKKRGATAVGIEPDKNAASQKMECVYQGTAEQIPEEVKNKHFDLISLTHVLEHCRDPITAIDNAKALGKPGAMLWIEVPNADCLHFATLNITSTMFDAPRHLHFFNSKNLRDLLERKGFEISKTYYQGFLRYLAANWRAHEQSIYDRLYLLDKATAHKTMRHTKLLSLYFLIRGLFASRHEKYDSVGMICQFKTASTCEPRDSQSAR